MTIGILLFLAGELVFLGQGLPENGTLQAFGALRTLRPVILLGDAAFGLGISWMGLANLSAKDLDAP